MKDLRKKAIVFSLAGFAAGIAVAFVFYALLEPEDFLSREENRGTLILYFFLSGLYGAVNMGTSALYGIDAWSILRCTLTHFLISVGSTIVFFGTMIALGWMDMPPLGFCALIGGTFVLVYALIWLVQYVSSRRQVKKMNAKLRQWKARRPREP